MHMGYVELSIRTMLQHLYNNYGVSIAVEFEDNDTTMRAEYDHSQPIEVIFCQIGTTVKFFETRKKMFVQNK